MSTIADSHLSNHDLATTGPEQRTWGAYDIGALMVPQPSHRAIRMGR